MTTIVSPARKITLRRASIWSQNVIVCSRFDAISTQNQQSTKKIRPPRSHPEQVSMDGAEPLAPERQKAYHQVYSESLR